MKKTFIFILWLCAVTLAQNIQIEKILQYDIGHAIGQLRAVPVDLGTEKYILLAHSEDAEIDPYIGMFFFPKSTTTLVFLDQNGQEKWKKDLGPGMVSGIWFLPIYAFDLNQDGNDEIWLVNNKDPEHPLDYRQHVLQRLNAQTGAVMDQIPWPLIPAPQSPSHTYRNFILGGYVQGEPVLVTGQGTYGPMQLQGWNPDLSQRWEYKIDPHDGGSAGSHVCPVVDIDHDGTDEFLWGERCISMDTGAELFSADKGEWTAHSDIVVPVMDYKSGNWFIHTCRESNDNQAPRIVVFDQYGKKVWGKLDQGHIDTGWAARLGKNGEAVVLGVRVGKKVRDQHGEHRTGIEPFTYDLSGKPIELNFNTYTTIPVDLNGDGIHELVRGYFEGNGDVLDRNGTILGNVGGLTAICSKFMNRPGEQILSYSHKTGIVQVWADTNATDTEKAQRRYANPFYKVNQKLTGVGYNLFLLGGI